MGLCYWCGLFDCEIYIFDVYVFLGAHVETLHDRFLNWVHMLEFLWVCLHNWHPWRFCMVVWMIFHYGLVMLWIYHPRRSYLGGCFVKKMARDINASLCEFLRLPIGMEGADYFAA